MHFTTFSLSLTSKSYISMALKRKHKLYNYSKRSFKFTQEILRFKEINKAYESIIFSVCTIAQVIT